jgi:hypothetical protein
MIGIGFAMKKLAFARQLAFAATAAVVLMGAGAARAQSDEGPGLLGAGFLSLFGVGPAAPPAIEYRERPPLVVPPRTNLPTPQAPGARSAANWPNDPDVQRRRAAAEEDNSIYFFSDRARIQSDRGNLRLSNDELARGRVAAPQIGSQPLGGQGSILDDNNARAMLVEPQRQMRAADSARRAAAAELPVGAEPARRQLTQPPPGLRAASQRVSAGRSDIEPVRGADQPDLGIRDFQRQQQRN